MLIFMLLIEVLDFVKPFSRKVNNDCFSFVHITVVGASFGLHLNQGKLAFFLLEYL